MATPSDQIQTEIAQTRARMSARLDAAGSSQQDNVTGLTSTISEQVRRRPLAAVGLSLVAGSLLQEYLAGGQAGSGRASASGATQPVGQQVSQAAQQVVDTTKDTAGAAVETATDVAKQVASTTGDVAHQVVATTRDAAGQVSQRATDLRTTATQQVQQRPLTAMGVAVATGLFLQPTLAPRVSQVLQSVRGPASAVGSGLSETFSLPEQEEVERIKAALVPATVERARQFASRDLREYLDKGLEGIVGPTSLRGGIVAAATEKAEDLVNNRLPDILSGNLSGTRGLLALAVAGEVLKARSEAQQGQGQTLSNIKTDLAQSITQTSRDRLRRYFPEFREQYESSTSGEGSKRCSDCGAELPPSARFCPSCGTPA